jgi:hypothetical protein
MKIYNTIGELVIESKEKKIDMNPVPNGVYIALIELKEGLSISKKIVVER